MQLPPEKQVGRTPTQRLNRVRFWLQLWNRVWRRNTIVSRRTVGLAVATCVSWIPSESFKCWWHTHSDCFFRPPFLWLIKRLWLLWFHSFFFFSIQTRLVNHHVGFCKDAVSNRDFQREKTVFTLLSLFPVYFLTKISEDLHPTVLPASSRRHHIWADKNVEHSSESPSVISTNSQRGA